MMVVLSPANVMEILDLWMHELGPGHGRLLPLTVDVRCLGDAQLW